MFNTILQTIPRHTLQRKIFWLHKSKKYFFHVCMKRGKYKEQSFIVTQKKRREKSTQYRSCAFTCVTPDAYATMQIYLYVYIVNGWTERLKQVVYERYYSLTPRSKDLCNNTLINNRSQSSWLVVSFYAPFLWRYVGFTMSTKKLIFDTCTRPH